MKISLFPETELVSRFAKVVKDLRLAKGFSQEELAFRADVDRTYISRLERGLKQPSIMTLFKLAKGLDIPASQIIEKIESVL